MVFFNYATMQMAAKIVYYGPGLCGKTTNLHYIYAKTSPQSRGEMVSLETETDRTLFFDLLPIDVGVIGGFKTRLQLYTIPGQVFYNTTRKLVLKGVDGLVFVADSQMAMQDANADSLKNLRENLAEIGLELDDIPLVIQMNKRDLPNVAPIETILDVLDPQRKYEHIEAIAATGVGVFETLKLISKLTLRTLRQRMTGAEPGRPVGAGQTGKFGALKVKETPGASARGTMSGSVPVPAIATPPPPRPAAPSPTGPSMYSSRTSPGVGTSEEIEEIGSEEEVEVTFSDPTLRDTADVGSGIISRAPVTPAPAPVREADISFSQTAGKAAAPEASEVKRVKVRSSVDIMAELEALRKRATAGPKARKETVASDSGVKADGSKREVQKTIAIPVPADMLSKARSMRVTVSFENSDGVLQQQEHTLDVADASDAQSLTVNLRIDS
jgi:signal recognition particle receptor subunit beta